MKICMSRVVAAALQATLQCSVSCFNYILKWLASLVSVQLTTALNFRIANIRMQVGSPINSQTEEPSAKVRVLKPEVVTIEQW